MAITHTHAHAHAHTHRGAGGREQGCLLCIVNPMGKDRGNVAQTEATYMPDIEKNVS